MSTTIKTTMRDHTAKRFWGGDDRGNCLQITASSPLRIHESVGDQLQEEGFVQLTMEEAAELCSTLGEFITEEAKRRQALLRDELEHMKLAERTVFHETAEFTDDFMDVPKIVVAMVSRFCPIVPPTPPQTLEQRYTPTTSTGNE